MVNWQLISAIIAIISILVSVYLGYQNIKISKENKGLKNQINVQSVNQQGGITAGAINVGSQPRQFTQNMGLQLEKMLKEVNAEKIVVSFIMGNAETRQFAMQIRDYLQKKEWNVQGGLNSLLPAGTIKEGVTISDKPDASGRIVIQVWPQQ